MFTAALCSALWQNQHHSNKYLKKKKKEEETRVGIPPGNSLSGAEAEILYNITGFKQEKPRRSKGGIPL